MIAFSCVHCGQRMKVTEDRGGKKAACSQCGQVVLIPPGGSRSGLNRRLQAGQSTAAPVRAASPSLRGDTPAPAGASRSTPAIHETPTRVGEPISAPASLTAFLAPAQAADEIGRLGTYRILDILGSGGMGVVFRAHDPGLDRLVAIKAIQPSLAASSTALERFKREAQAAAQLQHDHVVSVYHIGEDRGVAFLVMPLLRGVSLDTLLDGRPLPVGETLRIAGEVSEGLSAIHALGMVHRDIKPANIFLEGDARRVKILDFGLARGISHDVQLTLDGTIIGSPAYMAPEQAGRKPLDGRADLFSLGCVLYVMATGQLPFEGPDVLATLLAVTSLSPPPPHESIAEVPAGLSELIMRLLAKRPDDRPASARQVVEEVQALLPR